MIVVLMILAPLLLAIIAFLVGSIPFGYLIGRLFYRTDIRTQGSGNIGAMNALRTLGKGGAIAVLLLDAAKGVIPVALVLTQFAGTLALSANGHHLGLSTARSLAALVAASTILGHCFSPWLGWKGGKGVATAVGAIFALSWKAGLVSVMTWVLGALVFTQYSSVGSMAAMLISPIALWFTTGSTAYLVFGLFTGLFITWTHRENIERLRDGRENRIGLFKKT